MLERSTALARDIKLSHSVFALPFALLATFMAAAMSIPVFHNGVVNSMAFKARLPTAGELYLIVLCMVSARTFAMAVNRLADARLDAANPRTAGRAIPSGRLSFNFVLTAVVVSGLAFIASTAGFCFAGDSFSGRNLPLLLSPLVLAWLALYSYTKRFTWLCHLWLGISLAIAPLAATVAIRPPFLCTPFPWLLAAMVMCWVAGFDIIYALQDVEVDRAAGLYSIPARLGVPTALVISGLLHAVSLAALFFLIDWSPILGIPFAIGVAATGLLLLLEHVIVWSSKTHHINLVFFTLNGVISLLLGGLGIFDVVRSIR